MLSFSGYNVISLDSQKRMAMPSRYRQGVAEQSDNKLVVSRGWGSGYGGTHLQIYSLEKWQQVIAQISALPSMHPMSQMLRRQVIGFAFEQDLDKSSRLLIPQALREYASIDRQIVLSGVGDSFELWSEDAWNACMSAPEAQVDFDSLPESFQNLQLI